MPDYVRKNNQWWLDTETGGTDPTPPVAQSPYSIYFQASGVAPFSNPTLPDAESEFGPGDGSSRERETLGACVIELHATVPLTDLPVGAFLLCKQRALGTTPWLAFDGVDGPKIPLDVASVGTVPRVMVSNPVTLTEGLGEIELVPFLVGGGDQAIMLNQVRLKITPTAATVTDPPDDSAPPPPEENPLCLITAFPFTYTTLADALADGWSVVESGSFGTWAIVTPSPAFGVSAKVPQFTVTSAPGDGATSYLRKTFTGFEAGTAYVAWKAVLENATSVGGNPANVWYFDPTDFETADGSGNVTVQFGWTQFGGSDTTGRTIAFDGLRIALPGCIDENGNVPPVTPPNVSNLLFVEDGEDTVTPPPGGGGGGGGTFFFEADAESGSMPPWASYSPAFNGAASNSATRFKNGSRSYKYEVTSSGSPSDGAVGHDVQTFAFNPQVSMGSPNGRFKSAFWSWWMYIDAGWNTPADTSTGWNLQWGAMTGVSGSPSPIADLGLELRGGVLQYKWQLKNATSGVYTAPTIPGYTMASNGIYLMNGGSPAGVVAVPRAGWVHVCLQYDFKPSNGRAAIWQDGVLIMDLTAATFDTYNGSSINPGTNVAGDYMVQFGIYGGVQAGVQRMYVDDFRATSEQVTP